MIIILFSSINVISIPLRNNYYLVETYNSNLVNIDIDKTHDYKMDDLIERIEITPSKPNINENVTFTAYLNIPEEEINICCWIFMDDKVYDGQTITRNFSEKGRVYGVLLVIALDDRDDCEPFSIFIRNKNVGMSLNINYLRLIIWMMESRLNFNNSDIKYI